MVGFDDIDRGVSIQFHSDGKKFNLQHFCAPTEVAVLLIKGAFIGCALIAHLTDDIQFITDDFIFAVNCFGFTVSLKKIEVL